MSAALHRYATAPAAVFGGVPLLLAVALGLTGHHIRTRRTTR